MRLVASYEDPTIRNYVVDLDRYPELKKAMQSGETVFIPDAANDPSLRHVKGELINRRVKSITVVPITSNVTHVYPFQVLLPASECGLPSDSKAQAEQVRSVAIERVGRRVGQLPVSLLVELEDALRLHLAQ